MDNLDDNTCGLEGHDYTQDEETPTLFSCPCGDSYEDPWEGKDHPPKDNS